jgi:ribonuclease G
MTTSLLWDAGPGEVRVGLVEEGKLTEFRIARQHVHSHLALTAGEEYSARIVSRAGPNKALVILGNGVEAILQPAAQFTEGQKLTVEVTRAPVPEPGRWKLPLVRAVPETQPLSRRLGDSPEMIFARTMANKADQFICATAATANELRDLVGSAKPIHINPQAIVEADFDSLVEMAVIGEFPTDGGMLTIERTRAMTMIDIDGSGDATMLNLAAAREIPRLLRLLDIGGQIGIDFLTLPDRKARLALDAVLADACQTIGPHERTAVNGFGFVQIVRPRMGPSVSEILCETTPGRLSLDSKAVALLRTTAGSSGHGPRTLTAQPAIIDRILQWPDALAKLRSVLGVAIELVSDSSVTGYGHVHVSQS